MKEHFHNEGLMPNERCFCYVPVGFVTGTGLETFNQAEAKKFAKSEKLSYYYALPVKRAKKTIYTVREITVEEAKNCDFDGTIGREQIPVVKRGFNQSAPTFFYDL